MKKPTPKECILKDLETCNLIVKPNESADASEPLYEFSAFSQVHQNFSIIEAAAKEKGIAADLIRAIMYMETTHGYYDFPLSVIGRNKSILPMNMNIEYWGDAFGTREELQEPENNIRAGAEMLRRIIANLPPDPDTAQIATLYQNINATVVSEYGARVKKIYTEKSWHKTSIDRAR